MCECVSRSGEHDGGKRRRRERLERGNFKPVRFMASEKITGEGDEGELRSSNKSFLLLLLLFKEHVPPNSV